MSESQIDPRVALAAAGLTVAALFRQQVQLTGGRVAVEDARRILTYAELNARVNQLTHALASRGVGRGDRIAVLSENRGEYIELMLAAAKLGAILACQNWRQSDVELEHCTRLVGARLAVASERHAATLTRVDHGAPDVLTLGEEYERVLGAAPTREPPDRAEQEDGFVILYTSGTTGLPKAALISQRAMVARGMISCIDIGRHAFAERSFIAWAPLFHMTATDYSMATLTNGGKVIVMDGFDAGRLVETLAHEEIGYLTLMPGMIEQVAAELRRTCARPRGITVMGAMADLVPRQQLAEITTLLQAPYRNSFGATETGSPPAGRGVIPIGAVPERLSKQQSSCCQVRLVDEDDQDVADGEPGELALRGPSLFSGYWRDPGANAADFRGGWFHMGDVFVRNPDATLDFVDRRKYLIKSGGENIYPAEIERLLLASPRIAEAVVVRKPDRRWGEVPVAFVVPRGPGLTADDVVAACRGRIAGYKLPKAVKFVTDADLPRSTTGKIKRHELEAVLERDGNAVSGEPPAA